MNVYHHTKGTCLQSILDDREIKLATFGILPGEKAVVWCSTNEAICRTAIPGRVRIDEISGAMLGIDQLSIEEAASQYGLIRIGIVPEAAPHGWHAYKQLSGVKSKIATGLYRVAMRQDDRPGEWRCSFEPIPAEKWTGIEEWKNGEWSPLDVSF